MTLTDAKLASYIEHAELVGNNGDPAISAGELADICRELTALRKANSADMVLVPREPLSALRETLNKIASGGYLTRYPPQAWGEKALGLLDAMLASAPSSQTEKVNG